MSYNFEERECTNNCKSTQHGDIICAALSKSYVSDKELCSFLENVCCRCESVKDSCGRTALHVAASYGRIDVARWLCQNKHAQINTKDKESGYTALHRSIFYGKINVAVALLKAGAHMNVLDFNDFSPLDLVINDDSQLDECDDVLVGNEIYVWGTNANYALGTQEARELPEILDCFHREHPDVQVVQQVCLDKYHSVFVSCDGRAFSCGYGQGGRLGHDSEQSVLSPAMIKFVENGSSSLCLQASISRDHSVFLTGSGQVWTCGLNNNFVLGLLPPPSHQLTPKPVKLHQKIYGVQAARYGTVAYGKHSVFGWGLNGGQLGLDKTVDKYIVTPREVKCFDSFSSISRVVVSDAATVVVAGSSIYLLHEYQTRKIASHQTLLHDIKVIGGKLNPVLGIPDSCVELKIAVLDVKGNVSVWQETDSQFNRCVFNVTYSLFVNQIHLNMNEIIFVTSTGGAFRGTIKPRKNKEKRDIKENKTKQHAASSYFLKRDDCVSVRITKIPHVYRGTSVHSDPNGENFVVLQKKPFPAADYKTCENSLGIRDDLLNFLLQTNESDSIHDVVFKVSALNFPAHRFIVADASRKLKKLMGDKKMVELPGIVPEMFKQVLDFIYAGRCDLSTPGKCPDKTRDPLKLLLETAKSLEVEDLEKTLACLYYSNGFVKEKVDRLRAGEKIWPTHEDLRCYHDVDIKSNDGKILKAHKCMLAARMEYFSNLLSARWSEKQTTEVSLPISGNHLELLLHFIYTDSLPKEHSDMEALSSLLVIADQFLVAGLRNKCEMSLVNCLTLKNVANIFEFSHVYNAAKLKTACMDFILRNLAALLESRSLQQLNDALLDDLTQHYCVSNRILIERTARPYTTALSDTEIAKATQETVSKTKKPTKRRTRSYKTSVSESKIETNASEATTKRFDSSSPKQQNEMEEKPLDQSPPIRIRAINQARNAISSEEVTVDFTRLSGSFHDDFPELASNLNQAFYSKSPGKSETTTKHQSIPKLSQKQRKRLSSENKDNANTIPAESPKNPWKICEMPLLTGSPDKTSTISEVKMSEIINKEKTQKVNYAKMKMKQLVFTQLEDKALDDLNRFYNVENVYDEIITTHRVETEMLAVPVWVQKIKL